MTGTSLYLRTLGAAEACIEPADPSRERTIGSGKPLALLVWLAGLPRHTCRREQAIDLLWSDVHPEQGRHALRQTIWYLRRRLHDDVVKATRDSMSLGLTVRSDHQELLAAARSGRAEEAIALFGGDFLPGLAVPGGVEFEHWAEVERHH